MTFCACSKALIHYLQPITFQVKPDMQIKSRYLLSILLCLSYMQDNVLELRDATTMVSYRNKKKSNNFVQTAIQVNFCSNTKTYIDCVGV